MPSCTRVWEKLARPLHFGDVAAMKDVVTCCARLHNMIVVHRLKEQYAQSPST